MPELPEVETIRSGLAETIIGLKIKEIDIFWAKSFIGKKESLIGKKINLVERRGKNLILSTDGNYFLLIHLKMTGQLIYLNDETRLAGGHPSKDWTGKLPSKHTRIIFSFSNGGKLFFNDLRKFGWVKMVTLTEKNNALSILGLEPLSLKFKSHYLKSFTKKYPKRPIKQLLLDQSVIAGIGNIYADESLFLAKINPKTKLAELTDKDYQKIVTSVKKVLLLSLNHGGTSDSDYLTIEGKKGGMQDHLNVYHRQNKNCNRCGQQILKIKLAGRGTHYCPNCQKETES